MAGGFNVIGKLGSRYINSSIGSQWRTNVDVLEEAVLSRHPVAVELRDGSAFIDLVTDVDVTAVRQYVFQTLSLRPDRADH